MFVIHTREGHRADLSDLPDSKRDRGDAPLKIGDQGSMGRLLVRGEYGHGIVDELAPIEGEPVVDKPGKGAFYATDMDTILRMRGIEKLVFTGVTTEVCVTTSRARGERPRVRCGRPRRLRRVVLPGVPVVGAGDDQGPGRDLRLGRAVGAVPDRPGNRSPGGSRQRQASRGRGAHRRPAGGIERVGRRNAAINDTSAETLGSGRLERVLRVGHERPAQRAGPVRARALRGRHGRRDRVRADPAGAGHRPAAGQPVLRVPRLPAGA